MQAEVIDFLDHLSASRSADGQARRIETHGALVFLAGAEAYKIKRAVRFDYMDFSTLERRRRACQRELELNVPNAPGLYLGLVAIVRRADGVLAIGGAGVPVEWAVLMQRFGDRDLLSAVADDRGIDAGLARRLGDAVFASHAAAAISADARPTAQFDRLIAEVVQGLTSRPGQSLQRVADLERQLRRHLEACRKTLEQRAAQGCVRRCHGDLHLRNMVLWNGSPVLFDALEFDEALATIDTLYDLAFLLMDLDQRGARAAANAVLNRYLWRSGQELDLSGLAAMPLFLGLRAAIRAMVLGQRAVQLQPPVQAQEIRDADGYFAFAESYMHAGKPRLVAVGGLSGTGKSTLAATLAPALGRAPGAVHLRSDLERKAIFGTGELERLPAAGYTEAASRQVYAQICRKARAALSAGHSVIADAAFLDADGRHSLEEVARALDVPFDGLWLSAPTDVLLARVAVRTGDASDATVDVVLGQLRRGAAAGTWTPIDAGGGASDTLAAARLRLDSSGGADRPGSSSAAL